MQTLQSPAPAKAAKSLKPTATFPALPDSPRWQCQLVPPKDSSSWSLAERFAQSLSKEIWFPLAKVHYLPHLLWPSELIEIMAHGRCLSMMHNIQCFWTQQSVRSFQASVWAEMEGRCATAPPYCLVIVTPWSKIKTRDRVPSPPATTTSHMWAYLR